MVYQLALGGVVKGKRQKLKPAPLRVRQLERRRVLDAAVSSVVVSTVVVADAGQAQDLAGDYNCECD